MTRTRLELCNLEGGRRAKRGGRGERWEPSRPLQALKEVKGSAAGRQKLLHHPQSASGLLRLCGAFRHPASKKRRS